MNKAFTRLIKIRGLLREVNFRRLPHGKGAYHVDMTDERGTRFIAFMVPEAEGGWKLSPSELPAWITESAGLFSAAIEEAESSQGRDTKRTA